MARSLTWMCANSAENRLSWKRIAFMSASATSNIVIPIRLFEHKACWFVLWPQKWRPIYSSSLKSSESFWYVCIFFFKIALRPTNRDSRLSAESKLSLCAQPLNFRDSTMAFSQTWAIGRRLSAREVSYKNANTTTKQWFPLWTEASRQK